MIRITYHRKFHRVTVQGHAQSGEWGHDLVCASVSALAYTLAGNVASLTTQEAVRNPCIRLKEGDAEICCTSTHKMRPVVMLIFDTICTGFELLQTYYPENIRYMVME